MAPIPRSSQSGAHRDETDRQARGELHPCLAVAGIAINWPGNLISPLSGAAKKRDNQVTKDEQRTGGRTVVWPLVAASPHGAARHGRSLPLADRGRMGAALVGC